jgi:phosphoribosylformimino-5-aminoimidazole carboxamide ribotide isomerase
MNPNFILFPAIDLRGGQVVRLAQGDPKRQTAYSNDPAATARRWLENGAQWLHVVNLDGAFAQPDALNRQALIAILQVADEFGAQVQFGGGLRSLQDVQEILELGVSRAVLGTLAIRQPDTLRAILATWTVEQIAASLDCRDGLVTSAGWQETHPLTAEMAARNMREAGLEWLVFTDIAQDGLQTGLNLPATLQVAAVPGLRVIGSGGVRGLEDVHLARRAGLNGVIVGRALYEGAFNLKEALC